MLQSLHASRAHPLTGERLASVVGMKECPVQAQGEIHLFATAGGPLTRQIFSQHDYQRIRINTEGEMTLAASRRRWPSSDTEVVLHKKQGVDERCLSVSNKLRSV